MGEFLGPCLLTWLKFDPNMSKPRILSNVLTNYCVLWWRISKYYNHTSFPEMNKTAIIYSSKSLFCCLLIIVTWWYVWCIVWASGRVGVNSITELELQLHSNSNSGIEIGIKIGGTENGIGIENSGTGIENQNWIFCNCYHSIYQLTNSFLILALTEVIIFHGTDSSRNRFVLSSWKG